MTHPLWRVARWGFVLALAAFASLVESQAAKAQFFDFFQHFSPHRAPAYAPFHAKRPRLSRRSRYVAVWVPDRPRVRRSVRHASLHGPAPVRVRSPTVPEPARKEKNKAVPYRPMADPVAALMNDPTLRRGDIVVTAEGPKVFKGRANTPHRPSDFEDARRTKLVGAKTRRQLTAMPIQKPARAATEVAERPPVERKSDAEQKAAVTGSLPRKVGPYPRIRCAEGPGRALIRPLKPT